MQFHDSCSSNLVVDEIYLIDAVIMSVFMLRLFLPKSAASLLMFANVALNFI